MGVKRPRWASLQQHPILPLALRHAYCSPSLALICNWVRDGRPTQTDQIISTWLSSITLHLQTFFQSHICVYLHAVPSMFSCRQTVFFVTHLCLMIVIQRLRVEQSSAFILYSIPSQSRVTSKRCVKLEENDK